MPMRDCGKKCDLWTVSIGTDMWRTISDQNNKCLFHPILLGKIQRIFLLAITFCARQLEKKMSKERYK